MKKLSKNAVKAAAKKVGLELLGFAIAFGAVFGLLSFLGPAWGLGILLALVIAGKFAYDYIGAVEEEEFDAWLKGEAEKLDAALKADAEKMDQMPDEKPPIQ